MIGFVFWRSISLGGFYRLRWLRPFELSRRTFLVLGSIWGPGGGWGAARSSSDKSVAHLRRSGILVGDVFPAFTGFVALRVRPQGLTYDCAAPPALRRRRPRKSPTGSGRGRGRYITRGNCEEAERSSAGTMYRAPPRRKKVRAQTLLRWLRPFERMQGQDAAWRPGRAEATPLQLSRKTFLFLGSIWRRGGEKREWKSGKTFSSGAEAHSCGELYVGALRGSG